MSDDNVKEEANMRTLSSGGPSGDSLVIRGFQHRTLAILLQNYMWSGHIYYINYTACYFITE